jgi:CRP-like cAMP-binding protein
MEPKDQHQKMCSRCTSRCNSVFDGLSFDELLEIDAIKTWETYKKGDLIFSQGTHPKGLICVKKGKLKISQIGPDGKEQIVHLVGNGNVVGHRAILSDDIYSGSAIALEDSEVCIIRKSGFIDILKKNGKLTFNIAKFLAFELKEAEDKITSTAQKPSLGRIAEAIIHLMSNYGIDPETNLINVTVKREDFANMAGITRETAIRKLYELQKAEIIELKGKKIRIVNHQKLKYIADSET